MAFNFSLQNLINPIKKPAENLMNLPVPNKPVPSPFNLPMAPSATTFSTQPIPQVQAQTTVNNLPPVVNSGAPVIPAPTPQDNAKTAIQRAKDFLANFNLFNNNPPVPPPIPAPGPTGSTQNDTGNAIPPILPSMSPETQKALQDTELAYKKSLEISPEELSTQADLDKLIESTKKAYLNTSEQAIPLEFITGQLSSIEKRATNLAEPLERKLSRLQATRTASLEASKFSLGRLDKKVSDEKELNAPKEISVGASMVKYNPTTGKYENVFTNPKELTKPASAQEYEYAVSKGYTGTYDQYQNEDANRKRQIINVKTGQPDRLLTVTEAKELGVPYGTKESAAYGMAAGAGKNQAGELKTQALTSAKELLTKFQGGSKWAVGGTSLFGTLPGTQSRDFKVQFNNLKSLLSLDNVKFLKGQGQVSDAERKLLAEAAAKLELGQSESEFEDALKKIVISLSGAGEKTTATQSSSTTANTFTGPSGTTYKLPY